MQFPCAAFLPKNVKKLPFKSLCYFNLRLQSENVVLNAQTNVKSDKKCRSNIDILCSFGNFFNSLVFLSKAIKSQTFFYPRRKFISSSTLSLSIIKIAVKVQGCNAIFAQSREQQIGGAALSKSATTTVTEYFMEHYKKSGKNTGDHPKLRQFFRLKIEELTLHYHAIVAILYVILRETDL